MPVQLSLLSHPLNDPSIKPRQEVVQVVDVTRLDEEGKPVVVRSTFTIRMPTEGDTLPQVHDRQVIDVLVRDLVRLGVPDDDTIAFRPSTVLADLGLTDGGENYKTVVEAIDKYFKMEASFSDISTVPARKGKTLPYLTKGRIIEAYQIPKPKQGVQADGNNGWVKFGRWFTDELRQKNDIKYLSGAVLGGFKIGEHRRIYEIVRKFMGSKPKLEIGVQKLRRWIPYEEDLKTEDYVRKTKRAVEVLRNLNAFPRIESRGRGMNTIFVFYNVLNGAVELLGSTQEEAGEEQGGGAAGQGQDDAPFTRALSELRQLMTQEAKSDGRVGSESFAAELKETANIYSALMEKYGPDASLVLEVLADAKSALKEGRIKKSVRQYFIDALARATGNK
jgi:hypothetical protein